MNLAWGMEDQMRPPNVLRDARTCLSLIAFASMLCWIYVAAIAAFEPAALARNVADLIPVRRDTFGILNFVVSLGAHLVNGLGQHRDKAVARTTLAYSSLMIMYLLTNLVTHPVTMNKPLTHFASFPTEAHALALAGVLWVSALIGLSRRIDRGTRSDGE